MAPLLEDPRIRQTWNNISQNAETATETAAAGIWTFLHYYINPCFVSIGNGLDSCTAQCFPNREERARRLRERERARGRAEYSFDFYDDWEDDLASSSGGLLGWGNDELDRLLAGSGSNSHTVNEQPGRKRKMSYGTRKTGKRKGTLDGMPDPTVIPSTSALGFLQRLPFKIGGTLRYKPSAADLQDHPGHRDGYEAEAERLIAHDHHDRSDDEGDNSALLVSKTRPRSSTTNSGATGATSDSYRSRGDLFPSDGEEFDDAVPLSDEFAMALERRNTMASGDDNSSGRTRKSKGKGRPLSRTISRASHSSSKSLSSQRRASNLSIAEMLNAEEDVVPIDIPSLSELHEEEERLQKQEEDDLASRREAAIALAAQRGLASGVAGDIQVDTKVDVLGAAHQSPPAADTKLMQDSSNAPGAAEKVRAAGDDSNSVDDPSSNLDGKAESVFVPARLPNF